MLPSIKYLNTLPNFLLYFAMAIVFMVLFIKIYVRATPYNEIALIKQGNTAAAITLSGALIGFIVPVCAVIKSSVSIVDMTIWATIALLVQLGAFFVTVKICPHFKEQIVSNQTSTAIWLASLTITIGMLNAACMTY